VLMQEIMKRITILPLLDLFPGLEFYKIFNRLPSS